MTVGWVASGVGVGDGDVAAYTGEIAPDSATVARSAGTRYLIRCIGIYRFLGVRTLHACFGERQMSDLLQSMRFSAAFGTVIKGPMGHKL